VLWIRAAAPNRPRRGCDHVDGRLYRRGPTFRAGRLALDLGLLRGSVLVIGGTADDRVLLVRGTSPLDQL
jgi:hypothetical protein